MNTITLATFTYVSKIWFIKILPACQQWILIILRDLGWSNERSCNIVHTVFEIKMFLAFVARNISLQYLINKQKSTLVVTLSPDLEAQKGENL